MSSEWGMTTLGTVTTWMSGGTPKKDVPIYWNGDIPWISANSMQGSRFQDSDLKITAEGLSNGSRLAPVESVLLLVRGGALHSRIPVGIATREVAFNQDVKAIVAKPGVISPWYLLFWLMGQESFLLGNVVEYTGIGAGKLDTKRMQSLPLLLPSIEEQNAIVELVKSLDDRITLLRETNATLEAIAQALFKSWFVDFDPVRAKIEGRTPDGLDEATAALFPDSFEESELGLVPKGWRVRSLQECCIRVESGGTPKRTVPEYWNGTVSWLTSGEVRSPIVFTTKETITELGMKESSAKLWPVGTTVIAMYGATAGEVCFLAEPTTANQACCGLIPLPNMRTFLFLYARRERQNLASKSSGSAQQNLNKGLVANHSVIVPTDDVLTSYESIAGALLETWVENERQAQTLVSLRDTLLPRLISGQLRLPEAA